VVVSEEVPALVTPGGLQGQQLRQLGLEAWDQSEAAMKHALSQSLTVAFLGSASSGKDSAIRALFGIDFGDVSPIPGSTDRLKVAPLDATGQVLSLDIVLYVVNCEGGATIDEKRDLEKVRARNRPVLVCLNKIDLIRAAEREMFVDATLAQLGATRDDAAICAFDPLPQLSAEPIGVERVVAWIHTQLTDTGKELLFAKHLRNKAAACEPLLLTAARNASIAGAVPIPGADLAAVTAIQVKLIRDIAAVHEIPIDKDVALFIIGEVLSGGMRGFVKWGIEGLKAAGWIPGTQFAEGAILAISAMVAAATTYGVGKATIQYFQSGRTLGTDQLRLVFDAAAFEYKKRREVAGT
jgi:GTP-binding protein Era